MHTPGPWHLEDGLIVAIRNNVPVPVAEPRYVAAPIDHSQTRVRNEEAANARLISAAPDLLDALAGMLSDYAEHGEIKNGSMQEARAAIAKATGGQP